jgi:D-alanyl-D-alanine carboxypeptidase (penicillin-binding protein 5/6)
MKRATFFIIALLFFMGFAQTEVLANPEPPMLIGETCILMDVNTGQILYEKDAEKRMDPASTTKIMTAILALEKGSMEDVITVGAEPPTVEGSKINLREGEKLTLEQMLQGLLLNSGNDAAIAIAEYIGGSIPAFAKLMSQKAKEIGAQDTNYVNPHGLTDENHKTTAYDLAIISRYALLNLPDFGEIVSSKYKEIPEPNNINRKLENTNRLLWSYEGADGVKTGYTTAAGRNLVASATRDGWQLLAVVLKSGWDDIWNDAASLLNYGFRNFQPVKFTEKGEIVGTEKVRYGSSDLQIKTLQAFSIILPKGVTITKKIILEENLIAPIKCGTTLGRLEFYQEGRNIGRVDLVAGEDVKRKIYTYWWFWLSCIVFTLFISNRIIMLIKRSTQTRRNYYDVKNL